MRWIAVVPLLAASCVLPDRDNPRDPANAPIAELDAYVPGPLPGERRGEGSRQEFFVLDASGSHDPKGRTLSFAWDYDGDPSDFELLTTTGASVVTVSIPVGPEDFPADGIGSANRAIRVVVTAGGSSAEARDAVFVTNDAPGIDPGGDLFVPDRRGSAVVMDACGGLVTCASGDAEGDPLTFDWAQLSGDPVSLTYLDPAQRRASFPAPLTEQTIVFEVTADDGLAAASEKLRVYVGSVAWAATTSPARVLRAHRDFRSSLQATAGAGIGRIVQTAVDPITRVPWVAAFTNQTRVFRYGSTVLADDPSWLVGGASQVEVRSLAASGDEGCAVVFRNIGSFEFQRFRSPPPTPFVFATPGETPRFVAPAPGGLCWGLTDSAVYLLASTSLTPVASGFTDLTAQGLAEDGSIWVSDRIASGATRIVHVESSGSTELATVDDVVDAIAPTPDGTGVWTHSPTDLLVRRITPSDVPGLPDVVIEEGVSSLQILEMVSDPVDGSLWILDEYSGALLQFRDRGGALSFRGAVTTGDLGDLAGTGTPATGSWTSMALERGTGKVVAGGGYTLLTSVIAEIPSHLSRVDRLPVTVVNAVLSTDFSSGSLWIADPGLAVKLRRVDGRGLTLATVAVPEDRYVASVLALPDGSAYFSAPTYAPDTAGRLQRVSGDGSPLGEVALPGLPSVRAMKGDDQIACLLAVDQTGIGPATLVRLEGGSATPLSPAVAFAAGPTLAPDGSCWVFGTLPFVTVRVPYGSSVGSTFALADQPREMAVDPRDGSVYLSTTTAGKILHVSPGGTVTDLAYSPGGVPGAVSAVDRCADPADPDCLDLWVAVDGVLRLGHPDVGAGVVVFESTYEEGGYVTAVDAVPGPLFGTVP